MHLILSSQLCEASSLPPILQIKKLSIREFRIWSEVSQHENTGSGTQPASLSPYCILFSLRFASYTWPGPSMPFFSLLHTGFSCRSHILLTFRRNQPGWEEKRKSQAFLRILMHRLGAAQYLWKNSEQTNSTFGVLSHCLLRLNLWSYPFRTNTNPRTPAKLQILQMRQKNRVWWQGT